MKITKLDLIWLNSCAWSTWQHKSRPSRRSWHSRHDQGSNTKSKAQGRQSNGPTNEGNKAPKCDNLASKALNFKNKGKTPFTIEADMCCCCGSKNHWSPGCRASAKAVAEYHSHCQKFKPSFTQVENLEDTKRYLAFRGMCSNGRINS